MKRIWVDPDLLKKLHSEGLDTHALAHEFQVSYETICARMKELGLIGNTSRNRRGIIVDGMGRCSICHLWFPIERFTKTKSGHYFSYCNDCKNRKVKERTGSTITYYLNERYINTRKRAKYRGIPFDITRQEFADQFESQNGLCFYTGIPMTTYVGQGKSMSAVSVDKVIPELGYVSGNVVFCATRINIMKGDSTLDEMRLWMPLWYERATLHLKERGIY